ncbi:MAG: amino acid permease [Rhodanobacteraceae bacterium]|nr:amino acid permease [Rhodanobacteraceae bacterium]
MAVRKIGPLLATALVAGNLIGSGVFLLPASLATIGSSTVIGWVVALCGALLLAGMFAVLAATRPSPDGLVRWPAENLHPAFGFVAWASYWASNWLGNVAIALAAVGYFGLFHPAIKSPGGTLAGTLVLIWAGTAVCLGGARIATRIGGLTLVLGLLPILIACGVGFAAFSGETFAASWNVSGKPLADTIAPSLLTVFWAFIGLESAAVAAAVVENPRRNVPIAALGGVALAGVVYIAASVAVMGVIPAAELQSSTAPFADVVGRVASSAAGAFVAFCAIAKICGTLLGWFLVTGECGRSGAAAGFLPRWVSEADPEQLPRRGLVVLGLLMSVVALATASPTLNAQFNLLLALTVTLFMVVYALCALSLALDPRQKLESRALGVAALLFCALVVGASDWSQTAPALGLVLLLTPLGFWLNARRRQPA